MVDFFMTISLLDYAMRRDRFGEIIKKRIECEL